MQQPYIFSSTAVKEKPVTAITVLLERCMNREKLTRSEKDRIANICYGVFSRHSALYKLMGWLWDLRGCLQKYVVEFTYGDLQYYYAPDKSSLRKTLHNIKKIITVK